MNSTEDFTENRKISINRSSLFRGSTSSVKKKSFIPRQLMPLAPLDLNALKRELDECYKNENSDELLENVEETAKEITKSTNTINNNNNNFRSSIGTGIKKFNETKENVQQIKNNWLLKEVSEDSFDLGFSPLQIHTPLKKDILEKSEKFDSFVTPKVKYPIISKNRYSVPTNTLSSNYSSSSTSTTKKQEVNQNVIYSEQKTILEDETFSKLKVNGVEYLVLNLLGKGGSSKVYQCFCSCKRILVAIKCVSLENSVSTQGYINEVGLLQRLKDCDRIIKLYDYEILEREKKLLMVLERGGEDFSSVLKNLAMQKKNIPQYKLISYWMEMLLAVKQIHSKGIIHSDLKPSNFVVGDNGLKLIDFGISASVQSDMTSVIKTNPEGSCNYMSPEALNNDTTSPEKGKYKLHFKSDVWSLGCILYELVYKKTPFQHIKALWSKLAYILDSNHVIEYPEANWLPPKVINTIKKCLQYNVKARPSVEELLAEYDNF